MECCIDDFFLLQFCLGDTTQREAAVSTSDIMRAVQNQKSFRQILAKLNVGNQKQISKLLPSNIKFRQDVLHHCEMRFCESWVNSTFDIPFESSRVRESCAVLPHGITNEHSNIDGHQDRVAPNQRHTKHIVSKAIEKAY